MNGINKNVPKVDLDALKAWSERLLKIYDSYNNRFQESDESALHSSDPYLRQLEGELQAFKESLAQTILEIRKQRS